ncbi:MAG: hypothetical protein BHW24_00295 [Lachnospira eligens]|nr:MAG: hypothetical protein BHW24_00295 [Lachnospira eligens]
MAKSKKTKIHKKIDGQILQMNKQFSNLKMKQKDKITEWVYEEYKKYVTEHDKVPDLLADEQIVEAVLDKINEAQIWIPDGEIYDYYRRKKPQLQKRLLSLNPMSAFIRVLLVRTGHPLLYAISNMRLST